MGEAGVGLSPFEVERGPLHYFPASHGLLWRAGGGYGALVGRLAQFGEELH